MVNVEENYKIHYQNGSSNRPHSRRAPSPIEMLHFLGKLPMSMLRVFSSIKVYVNDLAHLINP